MRSSQQHAPTTFFTQPPQDQPLPIQAKSNEEGLAEHAERLRKFQRLGNSMVQMGPPRPCNEKTSTLQLYPWIQRKLTIGEPGDKYEQEADRVASQVVQKINSPKIQGQNRRQSLRRQIVPQEWLNMSWKSGFNDYEPLNDSKTHREVHPIVDGLKTISTVQRMGGALIGEASTNIEFAINNARSNGQPLDSGLQQSMGQVMGADFSGVRVHTDAQSDQLNQSIQARAFTTGRDIFFRHGLYQPENRRGQELIAHELTHVVQQDRHRLNLQRGIANPVMGISENLVQRAFKFNGVMIKKNSLDQDMEELIEQLQNKMHGYDDEEIGDALRRLGKRNDGKPEERDIFWVIENLSEFLGSKKKKKNQNDNNNNNNDESDESDDEINIVENKNKKAKVKKGKGYKHFIGDPGGYHIHKVKRWHFKYGNRKNTKVSNLLTNGKDDVVGNNIENAKNKIKNLKLQEVDDSGLEAVENWLKDPKI